MGFLGKGFLMTDILDRLSRHTDGYTRYDRDDNDSIAVMLDAGKEIEVLTAERDALRGKLAEEKKLATDHMRMHGEKADQYIAERKRGNTLDARISMLESERNAAEAAITAIGQQLAEAVEALEPFARIGGYLTPDCGWTPDDEVELMFGNRDHLLAGIVASHFIRAREVHRKAKA